MMESEQKIKNVAIYIRVSSEEQATHGYSLDSQLNRLRDYCRARLWTIAGEYTDDGFTGRNTARPAYQKMLAEVGKWDAMVVIKMDRIHRSQKNFLAMIETLAKQEKEFVSMSESFDTSNAMGRFVMSIISLIAQLESEQIGERVSAGFIQKVKSGKAGYMSHRVPFGYRWDKVKHCYLEVNDEVNIVKKIFKDYLAGATMKQLAEKTGLPVTSIRYYLHNTIYAGVERWCNFFRESQLVPIITIEEFNAVQKLIHKRYNERVTYEPLLIKNGTYKIDKNTEKKSPLIQRGKHNWEKGW